MSWRTSKLTLALRDVGRNLGVNSFLQSFSKPTSYEDKFNDALLSSIKKNDVVWDVGANVGHYTKLFAELAGPQGKVFAFEPSAQNYDKLALNVDAFENVVLLPYGLGNKQEKVSFKQGDDDLGATSQVVSDTASISGNFFEVDIRIGDILVQSGVAAQPNFVKIDVEGFELEVLTGMNEALKNRRLRAVGVEVHFGLLTARGMSGAPQQIESLLRKSGFSCTWPDSSHILASRPE